MSAELAMVSFRSESGVAEGESWTVIDSAVLSDTVWGLSSAVRGACVHLMLSYVKSSITGLHGDRKGSGRSTILPRASTRTRNALDPGGSGISSSRS
jgi:hypothetical protein